MKRVKAACIFQTLVFTQKSELGYSRDEALGINRNEFQRYKDALEKAKTRYQITDTEETDDGSIIVRIRKQYNDTADVSEYFN
ncbi:MAG: hypothetical protein IKK26_05975 [Clostridia bacterium]|nr:hypothetical protein [Clostridia bacterium]